MTAVSPAAGATGVALNSPVTANVNLPNGGLNPSTVNSQTVTLVNSSSNAVIPAIVNTTGGGDAIILTPSVQLKINTQYTFTVTSGVQDIAGAAMTPYTETFTTGSTPPPVNPTIAFTKQALPTAQGTAFTDLHIGPDGLLYASTEDGQIFRYVINADGTLGNPQIITSLQTFEGTEDHASGNVEKRLITGFAFDPASTPTNPILWVSNTYYALSGATNAPNFTSRLTVMSGPNLATVQDAIINLPRSVSDHVNDQPVFGPDGALYFCQAGQNAYGAPDSTWGFRAETILSAAILRLNTAAINLKTGPLNALTTDVGGTYNPFAAGAPLTIYADGIRNAFTLYWDSTGQLWAPVNGSASGGNTPAFNSANSAQVNGTRIDTGQPYAGPDVPSLTNVQQTEEDVLDKIVPGAYYGHPNPARGEYVLDDGNPSTGAVPGLAFSAYPSGTNPDANYHQPNFVFGLHNSPDGLIEYNSSAFGGALNGTFLVTEYSAGDDIAVLSRDANNNITSADRSISGFSGFNNPVTLLENPATGYIYVSELGADKLTLLRPSVAQPQITASTTAVAFNTVAQGNTGAATSRAQSVTITNTGGQTLNLGAITIASDPTTAAPNASNFAITNLSSLPASLLGGQSATINLTYTATAVGLQSALLQIATNDPATPTLTINLHGIGTAGLYGYNEPSLVQVLRANNIPTIVGAGPNDVNINTPTYPEVPDPSSQEVNVQRLVAAGTGPVTITPLASFDTNSSPAVRFGYYTPGDTNSTQELFTIKSTDAQTVYPTAQGATSFNPGASPFGLYAVFPGTTTPNGSVDIHYSEDALNTLDPTYHRKMRFFPLETSSGAVVPNAYVVAAEDYNSPTYNSFVNFVGIIRNVMPAPNAVDAPVLGIHNPNALPGTQNLVFNRIQTPSSLDPAGFVDTVHDTQAISLLNTGDQPLVISSLVLSDPTNWALVSPPPVGTTIAPGTALTLTIKFIATTVPPHTVNQTNDTMTTDGTPVLQAGGVWTGTLAVNTNDPVNPTRVVHLEGYWQKVSEHEMEPGLQTVTNLMLGYATNISNIQQPNYPNNGTTPVLYGEEINSAYWQVADPTQSVTVNNFHSWAGQYDLTQSPPVATTPLTGYFYQGQTKATVLFKRAVGNAQTFFPNAYGTTSTPLIASFKPTGTFGLWLDGEYSDASLNLSNSFVSSNGRSGHQFRFYPVRDSSGNIVPNTYLVGFDYAFSQYENYDYQDNLYIVSNITPAGKPATPADLQVSTSATGQSLQWAPVSGATGYNVYRSVNGSSYARINSGLVAANGYTDLAAPAGNSIKYEVTAVNSSNAESLPAYASLNLVGAPNGSTGMAPTAPTILTADGSSGSQVALTWSAPVGATTYNVYRQAPGSSSFVQVAAGVATTSYTDVNVVSGSTYTYEVQAVNSLGVSANSAPASATVATLISPPGTPTNLTAVATSGAQVVINWSAAANAATYTLDRENPGSTTFSQVATGLTTTTFTDTNVVAGQTYLYEVQSSNASGTSAFAGPASVTLPQPPATLNITVGKGANKFVTFTDADNTVTTIALNGPGAATVHFSATTISQTASKGGVIVTGTSIEIASITITGTTFGSILKITPKGGNGTVNIGGISVDASIGSIMAKSASLIGGVSVVGSVHKIALGSSSAASVSVGGTLGALQVTSAGGLTVNSAGAIKSISGTIWSSDGLITAPSIGAIQIKHNATLDISAGSVHGIHVGGTLSNATIKLTAAGLDLATLFAGGIVSSSIDTAGNIGTVTSGSLLNSEVFAGVASLPSSQPLPLVASDFSAQAAIASVNIHRAKSGSSDVNSNIAAYTLGSVSVGNAQLANSGQPFGVAAHTVKSFTAVNPATAKPFTLTKLTSAAAVTAGFTAKKFTPQDFVVRII